VGALTVPEGTGPTDEHQLTRIALAGHPDIQTAVAQANISHAAVGLACAERMPVTSVGPLCERGEDGTTFYGLAVDTQVPILNAGRRLVSQREAEHRRDLVAAEHDHQDDFLTSSIPRAAPDRRSRRRFQDTAPP
jgi:outer membrane protein TolC